MRKAAQNRRARLSITEAALPVYPIVLLVGFLLSHLFPKHGRHAHRAGNAGSACRQCIGQRERERMHRRRTAILESNAWRPTNVLIAASPARQSFLPHFRIKKFENKLTPVLNLR